MGMGELQHLDTPRSINLQPSGYDRNDDHRLPLGINASYSAASR
jgi:hypothetical protein